jgi:hypothetical protein
MNAPIFRDRTRPTQARENYSHVYDSQKQAQQTSGTFVSPSIAVPCEKDEITVESVQICCHFLRSVTVLCEKDVITAETRQCGVSSFCHCCSMWKRCDQGRN